ncbi:MAG TPA: HlyD family efflux transporter periplasmic adaptor subunit [Candidatus Acidoferrales bacterium]|nr:HlyD family efflux transporter periplasmic adaptor subunit [Candidatus Acidoferrum sp.]HUJ83895.1 HlyD family efflux transporter periplasmic adaptor subunit [Candidatus Acidoferrales bacterium]
MRFGPTSLQLPSVLAKGLNRPKLRSDLRISEQHVAGETSYVVKIVDTSTYNRYGAFEMELLRLFDGTRTPAEVATDLTALHPDTPVQESDILEFLDSTDANLWERSVGEKNLAVLERIRDERKSRINQSSLLYIYFKAWNPNRTLTRMEPYLRWLYTPGFVLFSIAVFVIAMSILAGDWARVQKDTEDLYSFTGKSAYDIWAFWIIMLTVGGIHEFGHGLTCKHFGGDVNQMGFLLIYFTPAFYTDTTDILLFESTAPREFVIFAGIWVELVLCSLSTFVWALSVPGTLVNDLAYKTLLLSGVTGALLNLNPLIKADGYYAISQFLHIDCLREDSFAYLQAWFQRYFLRRKIELPPASRKHRRVFLAFGLSAITYSTLLLFIVLAWVNNILVSRLGAWGYVATGGILYFLLKNRIRQSIPYVRGWWLKSREAYMRWKMTRKQQLAAAAVAVVLVSPFASKVSSEFILEPASNTQVRALVSGRVREVKIHPGDAVRAGDILAELTNPEITARATVAAGELGLNESDLRTAQASSEFAAAGRASAQHDQLGAEVTVAQTKLAQLTLRAPVSGVVATPDLIAQPGEFVREGDDVLRILDRSNMRARILVHDWEVQEIAVGQPVEIQVLAHPYRSYAGHIERILPAAAADRPVTQQEKLERQGQEIANYFAVEMVFPNPDGTLLEGMTGSAKISGKRSPLVWQWGRGFWRWLRLQIW